MSTKSDGRLPLTRKEQIPFLLKNEIGILFLINIMFFVFVIPLIMVFFLFVTTFHYYSLDDTKTSVDFFNVFLSNGLIFIPAITLVGIGRAGLVSVIKQLTFESTAKVSTFFKGIIRNFKPFFFFYLFIGVLSGLLVINFGYFRYLEGNIFFKGILLGANILLLLSTLIALSNFEFEGVTFNNYLFAYYRNGIYLFYKGFPLSIINFLLVIIPIVGVCFTPISLFFIPLGIIATFYSSLSSLISFIITLYNYEKIVPKENISEIYHKGLEDINL